MSVLDIRGCKRTELVWTWPLQCVNTGQKCHTVRGTHVKTYMGVPAPPMLGKALFDLIPRLCVLAWFCESKRPHATKAGMISWGTPSHKGLVQWKVLTIYLSVTTAPPLGLAATTACIPVYPCHLPAFPCDWYFYLFSQRIRFVQMLSSSQ